MIIVILPLYHTNVMKRRNYMNKFINVEEEFKSKTDPDGWYTGVTTTDEYDEPIQDADDL